VDPIIHKTPTGRNTKVAAHHHLPPRPGNRIAKGSSKSRRLPSRSAAGISIHPWLLRKKNI